LKQPQQARSDVETCQCSQCQCTAWLTAACTSRSMQCTTRPQTFYRSADVGSAGGIQFHLSDNMHTTKQPTTDRNIQQRADCKCYNTAAYFICRSGVNSTQAAHPVVIIPEHDLVLWSHVICRLTSEYLDPVTINRLPAVGDSRPRRRAARRCKPPVAVANHKRRGQIYIVIFGAASSREHRKNARLTAEHR